MEQITLTGEHVRLEPLGRDHVAALTAAAAEDRSPYTWSFVPNGPEEMARYVEDALALHEAGRTLPFAIVRIADGTVVGSTRFFDLERWRWPAGHARAGRSEPDTGEIGYTWLAKSAIRTAANTEAKLLMLDHAFERWHMLGVCFHTDERNEASARALARIGARFEGILHAHRLAVDFQPRNSKRFAIAAAEWPQVKARLRGFVEEPRE